MKGTGWCGCFGCSGFGVGVFWQDGNTIHLSGTVIEVGDVQYRKSDDVPYKVDLGRGRCSDLSMIFHPESQPSPRTTVGASKPTQTHINCFVGCQVCKLTDDAGRVVHLNAWDDLAFDTGLEERGGERK